MISVVVVNWNGQKMLPALLTSLIETRQGLPWEIELILVDNASTDGSVEIILKEGQAVQLVRSPTNLGFAGGCNLGARRATAPYLLFLNPDTQVSARALQGVVDFMEDAAQATTGIVGIQLLDEQGQVTRSCARFPRASMFLAQNLGLDRLLPRLGHTMREWAHDQTQEVDQVIGAFFLTRRELFERLGGFDERFFVYFEEVDYAYRAHLLGLRSVYLSGVQAFHEGEGTTSQIKGRRLFYSLQSRLLYGRKYYGPGENLLNFANTLLLEPLSRAAFLLLSGRKGELPELREGFGLLYRALPSILTRRMRP
ncbi:glycosyltransferase family 2 protein [Deinococcus deserti]|uniref:Putative glycosyl transferase n=1 Tax=Deinococcus deserti (strain DSM 17065 / CIP 109153 / LMG 22923 / VCD115) TaxID=546414 RepID=C1CY86_DEIDV|nr:glycosyltransferase family 2 protein [Deinococcus deserti]ACO47042.1 putative glycosyl transferase [Deinococcus deserti VCD115]